MNQVALLNEPFITATHRFICVAPKFPRKLTLYSSKICNSLIVRWKWDIKRRKTLELETWLPSVVVDSQSVPMLWCGYAVSLPLLLPSCLICWGTLLQRLYTTYCTPIINYWTAHYSLSWIQNLLVSFNVILGVYDKSQFQCPEILQWVGTSRALKDVFHSHRSCRYGQFPIPVLPCSLSVTSIDELYKYYYVSWSEHNSRWWVLVVCDVKLNGRPLLASVTTPRSVMSVVFWEYLRRHSVYENRK